MARGNHCSLAFGRLTAILVPPSEDAIALHLRSSVRPTTREENGVEISTSGLKAGSLFKFLWLGNAFGLLPLFIIAGVAKESPANGTSSTVFRLTDDS